MLGGKKELARIRAEKWVKNEAVFTPIRKGAVAGVCGAAEGRRREW